jgi:hypothetical protein
MYPENILRNIPEEKSTVTTSQGNMAACTIAVRIRQLIHKSAGMED